MHARTTITEIGYDTGALRREDREAVLFDLGLGASGFDFCVRSSDAAQVSVLRGAVGRTLLAEPRLFTEIVDMSPQRVFASALGRIEVYQRIGTHGGATPDGPHTHLLPRLLRCGRTQSASLPVPRDWLVCATLYPAHPLRDRDGEHKPFDADQHAAFQALLRAFGDAPSVAMKDAVWRAVRNAEPPAAFPALDARHARLARRVALRQIACIDGASPQLALWQRAFDPPSRTVAQASALHS